jgi:hypothetical protein
VILTQSQPRNRMTFWDRLGSNRTATESPSHSFSALQAESEHTTESCDSSCRRLEKAESSNIVGCKSIDFPAVSFVRISRHVSGEAIR